MEFWFDNNKITTIIRRWCDGENDADDENWTLH